MGEIRENLKINLGYYLSLNKMSQKELAEILKVSQAAVTNWIKGKNSPDIELVAKICEIFCIEITNLMGVKNTSTSAIVGIEKNPLKQRLEDNRLNDIIDIYNDMNEEGRDKLETYANDLIGNPRHKKENQLGLGAKEA